MDRSANTNRFRSAACRALLLLFLGCAALAGERRASAADYQEIPVKTPDGLTVRAQVWGNPNGPGILFIHGYMQSHLSWLKQLRDPALAREFRMVSYDIRGHGESDKPLAAEYYNSGGRYADELKAVMEATGLHRPVLVGWSYGSRIVSDYLVKYGDGAISGIDFVGGAGNGDPRYVGPGGALIAKTLTEDLADNIAATAQFLHLCFQKQPTEAEFETMLAFNMVVPPQVRAAMRRPAPYEAALKAIRVPTLVTHGVEDQVLGIGLGRYLVATVPHAQASFYEGVGHSPFWEEPARFNAELAAFARRAEGPAPTAGR